MFSSRGLLVIILLEMALCQSPCDYNCRCFDHQRASCTISKCSDSLVFSVQILKIRGKLCTNHRVKLQRTLAKVILFDDVCGFIPNCVSYFHPGHEISTATTATTDIVSTEEFTTPLTPPTHSTEGIMPRTTVSSTLMMSSSTVTEPQVETKKRPFFIKTVRPTPPIHRSTNATMETTEEISTIFTVITTTEILTSVIPNTTTSNLKEKDSDEAILIALIVAAFIICLACAMSVMIIKKKRRRSRRLALRKKNDSDEDINIYTRALYHVDDETCEMETGFNSDVILYPECSTENQACVDEIDTSDRLRQRRYISIETLQPACPLTLPTPNSKCSCC